MAGREKEVGKGGEREGGRKRLDAFEMRGSFD